MANPKSLDNITEGLQGFVESLKAVSKCSQAGEQIVQLKETVRSLSIESEKVDFSDSDFFAYKREIRKASEIIVKLENPCTWLNESSKELFSLLREVIDNRELNEDNFSYLRQTLQQALKVATDFCRGANGFKNAIEAARVFCGKAIENAQNEAEKQKKEASSKRKKGILGGAGLAGLGVGALALGIAGIATGGAAFIAAGGVGAAVGGAGIASGAAVATVGILSAGALDQRAGEFLKAVNQLELAKTGVDGLEQDLKKGVLKLSEELVQYLETALGLFGKMEQDAKEKRQLQDENAELRRQLKELKMTSRK